MKKNFFVGESRGLEVVSKTLPLAKAVIRLATSNRQVLKVERGRLSPNDVRWRGLQTDWQLMLKVHVY